MLFFFLQIREKHEQLAKERLQSKLARQTVTDTVEDDILVLPSDSDSLFGLYEAVSMEIERRLANERQLLVQVRCSLFTQPEVESGQIYRDRFLGIQHLNFLSGVIGSF